MLSPSDRVGSTNPSTTGSPGPLILIVEDEPLVSEILEAYLRRDGYSTRIVSRGDQVVAVVRSLRPDVILLDVNLPGMDGFDVLSALRVFSDVPVIMITARVEDLDRLVGFRLGADDYVTKPFNTAEIVARVRAVLRRASRPRPEVPLRAMNIVVDTAALTVTVDNLRVALTASEYRILEHLFRHPRRAFTRSELQAAALTESDAYDRIVDAHIGALRRKLRAAGARDVIETVRGIGYRLWPEPDASAP
jgi:two-component system, OmpR family, response regulator AdeR